MSESPFSAYWYRVAELHPRLRGHAELHRHHYRGQRWWVLQDRASGRHHRFHPHAYELIARMDGRRSLQEIWHDVATRLGDEAPTQDEVIQLLARLHAADVLQCEVPPDALELLERMESNQRARWKRSFGNPLAIRIPLFDPEPWVARAAPWVRPIFGWGGALLWLTVVGAGAVLAALHWSDVTENLAERVLAAENLLLLWLAYPLVKAVHEAGHALATKVWGGEVHEAGIVFLVFVPVPYVDASAASAFASRRRRMLVGAAGIAVELFLAAIGLFVWLSVEPGWVRTLAYDVMMLGSLSTLLFNGNPLLRFDGYYVLSDALHIPNLGSRANQYLGYLVQRHAFGVEKVSSPATAPGEEAWFVGYGIASFVYRTFILLAIALMLADRVPGVGLLLALALAATQLLLPAARQLRFLLTDPSLRRNRARAVAVTSLAVALAALVVFAVPLPLRTRAEGVIWPPERAQVRAGTDGFVQRVLAVPDSQVQPGEPLIESEDPFLRSEVKGLEARLRELRADYDARLRRDLVEARILEEKIAAAQGDLERARERLGDAVLRSPAAGRFVLPDAVDLPGRFVRQGDVLGYVTDFSAPTARVVVRQQDIALVRQRTRSVAVRLAERPERVLAARVQREVPSASNRLPTRALGSAGGGSFAVDPQDEDGLLALETVFQFDLALPADTRVEQIGGRVHVLFEHGSEPLGRRSYRALRRLFLRRFGV